MAVRTRITMAGRMARVVCSDLDVFPVGLMRTATDEGRVGGYGAEYVWMV